MFAKWKAAKAARRAANAERRQTADKIEQDDYLRRLQNSARMLTGTTHSGAGCEDTLDPYEIRAVLRRRLRELAKPETEE